MFSLCYPFRSPPPNAFEPRIHYWWDNLTLSQHWGVPVVPPSDWACIYTICHWRRCSLTVAVSLGPPWAVIGRWSCCECCVVIGRSAPAAPAAGAPGGEGGPPAPQQPPNLTSNRRLQQTQAQVDEVVDIMRVNVDKVLERDQKLSELDDRADALQAGASQFETSAAKLKRKYWWKNLKMMIILGVICAIILIIVIGK
ncbi:VAMP2 protein, partial [Amia calva]|nr:VAMP2 protein [Amia calva]